MKKVIKRSVHDIVDLLLRKGHLDTRIFNQASMNEGTRLHSLYQSEQGGNYQAEVSLSEQFDCGDFVIAVSGQADGIFQKEDGTYFIEEIKTTVDDLSNFAKDHNEWHLGQAMFYAYMFAKRMKLEKVGVLLTYMKQSNYRIRKQIEKEYTFSELSDYINYLILKYTQFLKKVERMKDERDESCKDLIFPYQAYRNGQKEMIDFVAKAAQDEQKIFIQAPTGIGKTISVLYPLLSRFGNHQADRIYYLTSKNAIKQVAIDTMKLFHNQGVKAKSIAFTSKENICFNDKKGHCNPEECPFAQYYYDKIFELLLDSLEYHDYFDRAVIEKIAYENTVCPFQLQLDLSAYCDTLVLDYSYIFDYRDRLALEQSNIKETKSYLLIDECHNLPDRVRDMYSLTLVKESIEKGIAFCIYKEFNPLKSALKKAIKDFESINIEEENVNKEGIMVTSELPFDLVSHLTSAADSFKSLLRNKTNLITDEMLEFFYLINSFVLLSEIVDQRPEQFLLYYHIEKDEITSLRIANLDSRELIQDGTSLFRSTTFFTATLSPKEYYIDLLGGNPNDEEKILFLDSPFPKENRRVFIDSQISLRYKDRDQTLFSVYSLVKTAVSQKVGNYFIFCPSFEYLTRLYSFFEQEGHPEIDLIVQTRMMSENERQAFLERFQNENEKTTVGLLVLGGVFSEGIDLVGDRLIGAIIISAGLPQVNFERDQIKAYYDNEDADSRKGFHYAYTYPGINRTLQAAGRVIRTENDRGFILYIDSRFRQTPYRTIINELYPDKIEIISPSQLRMQLRQFWKEQKP